MKLFGFDLDLTRNFDTVEGAAPSRPIMETKVGAGVSATRVDKNGVVWNISGITSLQADAPTYSPPGQVFGNTIDEIAVKIDQYAATHGPPDGAWNSLGAYVDKNLGVWMAPEDMWVGPLAACVVTGAFSSTCPLRWRSRSFSYGPDTVYVESATNYEIKGLIDKYAATHNRPGYGLPTPAGKNPVPPPKPGAVTPPDVVTTLPPVTVSPDSPGKPVSTPPTPSPGPVAATPATPVPVTGNSGLGGLALLAGGVGAVLWAVA